MYGYNFANYDIGPFYHFISAKWVVPQSPSPSYNYPNNSKLFYLFPGIQNRLGILQPVLSYGYHSPSSWEISSWYCDRMCLHSGFKTVSPGDSLYGDAFAHDCADYQCQWDVNAKRMGTSDSTSAGFLDVDDNAYLAVAGAAEVYGLTTCSNWPAGPYIFSSIVVHDQYGTVTPTWSTYVVSNPSPSCSFGGSSSGTSNMTLTVTP